MIELIVIVAYRPKPGKEKELLELVRNRVPTLRKENLVTDRAPAIMRARRHDYRDVRMEIAGRDRYGAQKSKCPGAVEQILRDLRMCFTKKFWPK
jgi:hypothetical protein